MIKKLYLIVILFFCTATANAALPTHLIKLPPGFQIDVYAEDVPNARSMVLTPRGTLFVGNRSGDKVFALRDTDGDHKADVRYTIAERLNSPNGVAFHNGSLYVAEINRILRFDNIEASLDNPPEFVVVRGDLPKKGWHGWKFIRIGPDGKLYVPVGAPCNVCEKKDERFASILRMNLDGSDLEVFVEGVRNTVGFDWDPRTGDLWFTDNGRDNLGDNVPPDELNHAPKQGMHFGFPYCHGGDIVDPKFNKKGCDKFVPPAQNLGPHVASLGMRFYTGDMFPETYKNQIFIAEHGSWNRSDKIGYRVSLVELEGNTAVSYKTFAEGWLQPGEQVWGRPVDVLVMPDGALLVSDDHAGAIYRISYEGP